MGHRGTQTLDIDDLSRRLALLPRSHHSDINARISNKLSSFSYIHGRNNLAQKSPNLCSNVSSVDKCIQNDWVGSETRVWCNKEAPVLSDVAKISETGAPGSVDFHVQFWDSKGWEISPLHGIPLYATSELLTTVCLTPRGQWIETECSHDSTDSSDWASQHGKGELEGVLGKRIGCGKGGLKLKCFGGIPTHFAQNARWNLGLLPQTWANPELPNLEYGGIPYDGRPMEVVDISIREAKVGEVYAVKPLAAFGVISFNLASKLPELSWKLIAIRSDDVQARELSDAVDVNCWMPGLLEDIREWLRRCHCLVPGDKPRLFGLNERATGRREALSLVQEGHASWQLLASRFPTLLSRKSPQESLRENSVEHMKRPDRTLSPDSPLDMDMEEDEEDDERFGGSFQEDSAWGRRGESGRDRIPVSDPGNAGKGVLGECYDPSGSSESAEVDQSRPLHSVVYSSHQREASREGKKKQKKQKEVEGRIAKGFPLTNQQQLPRQRLYAEEEEDEEVDIIPLCLGRSKSGRAAHPMAEKDKREKQRRAVTSKVAFHAIQSISSKMLRSLSGRESASNPEIQSDPSPEKHFTPRGYYASASDTESGWDAETCDVISLSSTPRLHAHSPITPRMKPNEDWKYGSSNSSGTQAFLRMQTAPIPTRGVQGRTEVLDRQTGVAEKKKAKKKKGEREPVPLELYNEVDSWAQYFESGKLSPVVSPCFASRQEQSIFREPENCGRGRSGSQGRNSDKYDEQRLGVEREKSPVLYGGRKHGIETRSDRVSPMKSPRAEILRGMPQHVEGIAMQLNETDAIHARFNSKLADAKRILKKLRSHSGNY